MTDVESSHLGPIPSLDESKDLKVRLLSIYKYLGSSSDYSFMKGYVTAAYVCDVLGSWNLLRTSTRLPSKSQLPAKLIMHRPVNYSLIKMNWITTKEFVRGQGLNKARNFYPIINSNIFPRRDHDVFHSMNWNYRLFPPSPGKRNPVFHDCKVPHNIHYFIFTTSLLGSLGMWFPFYTGGNNQREIK